MRDFGTSLLAVIMLVVASAYAVTGGFSGKTLQVGSLNLRTDQLADTVTLVNATTGAATDNYDSADFPRGTDYSVPANRSLRIGAVQASNPTSGAATVEIGYGDTHVENSVAAPTNSVLLGTWSLPASSTVTTIDTAVSVPAGKHPWVRVVGTGAWPSDVVLFGIIER